MPGLDLPSLAILMRQPPNRPDTVSHLASVRHTTVSMTNPADRVEIITSVQRRRRWTASEKVRMVEETFEPGMTVSLVARQHGVAPNQLFTWRRLVAQGALTAAGSGEEVVPASDYRALQSQVRELQRLLGKKTYVLELAPGIHGYAVQGRWGNQACQTSPF